MDRKQAANAQVLGCVLNEYELVNSARVSRPQEPA